MKKAEILKYTGKVYEEAENEILDAMVRMEMMADSVVYEGLLWLDVMREEWQEEAFAGKDILLNGMEWVADGMEIEYIKECMENLIDAEENIKEKVFGFLYMTTLLQIREAEPRTAYIRRKYLACLFPVKYHNKLFSVMDEYANSKKEERRIENGIDILKLHYEIDRRMFIMDETLEKRKTFGELEAKLKSVEEDSFKELYRKMSREDWITMLLVGDEKLREKMEKVMTEPFKSGLKYEPKYGAYIKYEQIKKAMSNWYKKLDALEGGITNE